MEDTMRYEVLLFDLDDTLFDFRMTEKQALEKVFAAYDLLNDAEAYKATYHSISKGIWRELEQGEITLAELRVERFKRLFNTHEIEIDPETFSHDYLAYLGEGAFLKEGAVELCEALSHLRLAIVTNGFRVVQIPRISHSPLCHAFEQIIISEDAGFQKPQREIFDYTFSKMNITDKSKVLMIGDSLTSDIRGGNAYGIDTCWFNPDKKVNETGIEPTYEIDKLIDLVKIVE
jgi:2-haloacid dehalogenase